MITKKRLMEMAGLSINENTIQLGQQFEDTWEKAYKMLKPYNVGRYVRDKQVILVNLMGKLAAASTSKIQQTVSSGKELVPSVCKSLFGDGSEKVLDAEDEPNNRIVIVALMDFEWGRFEEADYRAFLNALESGDAKLIKQYPSAGELFSKVGSQGEAELVNTYKEVFDAAMDIFNKSFPDYTNSEAKKMNFPKKGEEKFRPSYDPKDPAAKKAMKSFVKDASLKREFEQWLADELDSGMYTREDLIDDFGPGMDEYDFDMDEIVSNIINKKKYQTELGEFFSEFEATNGK